MQPEDSLAGDFSESPNPFSRRNLRVEFDFRKPPGILLTFGISPSKWVSPVRMSGLKDPTCLSPPRIEIGSASFYITWGYASLPRLAESMLLRMFVVRNRPEGGGVRPGGVDV